MEGTLEELRRISNCPEGATFSQLGLRKSVACYRCSQKRNPIQLHGYIKTQKTAPTRRNPGSHAFRSKNFGLKGAGAQETADILCGGCAAGGPSQGSIGCCTAVWFFQRKSA